MKIWSSYGTEHSHNLVLIGSFKTVQQAQQAEALIESFKAIIESQGQNAIKFGGRNERYPKAIQEFIQAHQMLYEINPAELEQLLYGASVVRTGNTINVTTDELDVSALMKIFVLHEAKVEIYSAHDYPHAGLGRDTSGS